MPSSGGFLFYTLGDILYGRHKLYVSMPSSGGFLFYERRTIMERYTIIGVNALIGRLPFLLW